MGLAGTQPIKSTHTTSAQHARNVLCTLHYLRRGQAGRSLAPHSSSPCGRKDQKRRGELGRCDAIPRLRRGRPIFISLEINYGRRQRWGSGGSGGVAKASPGITPQGALEPLTRPAPHPPPHPSRRRHHGCLGPRGVRDMAAAQRLRCQAGNAAARWGNGSRTKKGKSGFTDSGARWVRELHYEVPCHSATKSTPPTSGG